jgi:hypothetical protein
VHDGNRVAGGGVGLSSDHDRRDRRCGQHVDIEAIDDEDLARMSAA